MAGIVQASDGPTSVTVTAINDLIDARNRIQAMIDRLNGSRPLFVRGRVVGLANGSVPSTQTG